MDASPQCPLSVSAALVDSGQRRIDSIIPFAFVDWFSAVRTSCLLFPVCLFISVWTHGFLPESVGYDPVPSLCFWLPQRSQIYPGEEPLEVARCVLWDVLTVPCVLPNFGTRWVSQARPVLSLPLLWGRPLLQGALFFLWTVPFRNQDLGVYCAHCQWGVCASRPSRWPELGIITHVRVLAFL